MEIQGMIDDLYEAQCLIKQGIDILKGVAKADKSRRGQHYYRSIIANLEIIAGRDHEWLSRDDNIDDWLDDLESENTDESIMEAL
jgi:hypothetical protein